MPRLSAPTLAPASLTAAQQVLQAVQQNPHLDPDDAAREWLHTYFEIEGVDAAEDAPLAYAWEFDDGSVLYQPEVGEQVYVVEGRPGGIDPRWPVPPQRILFQQRSPWEDWIDVIEA